MSDGSLRDLFQLVKHALPAGQKLMAVSEGTPARVALERMRAERISQIPVTAGNEVIGVFSYRSFADALFRITEAEKGNPLDFPVDEYVETLAFSSVHDDLAERIDELGLMDAVLVGSPERPLGILTTFDALMHFFGVASPYLLLQEIELAIRELIRSAATDEQLADCINRSLAQHYEQQGRTVPTSLEALGLADYVNLLRNQDNWQYFGAAFGGTPKMVAARLHPIPELRNDIFHFRRKLTDGDHTLLRSTRDWLRRRINQLVARKGATRG